MDLKVTLEDPWAHDVYGREVPVSIRYGSTTAREVGGGGSILIGAENVSSDDLNDAGSFQDLAPRPQRQVIPGRRVEWALSTSDEAQNGLLLPLEAVVLWFGNWRYPKQAEPGTAPDETFAYERNRVAMKWGWWKMPQQGPSGLSHLRRGEEGPDTTKIGPPPVPKVLIQSVDGRGQVTDKLSFRPWDWFRWQDDVIPAVQSGQHAPQGPGVEAFTLDQLRRMVAELESREKKAQKVG